MRLQTGIMSARQGIKIHGKNPLMATVTEERSSQAPSPVSSNLSSQQSATFSNKSLRLRKGRTEPGLTFPLKRDVWELLRVVCARFCLETQTQP